MRKTTNYNLNKPEGTDYAKISALNENADIIDTALKELEDNKANSEDLTQLQEELSSHLAERNPHGTTASDVGAVNKKGDTMTGTLTLPSLVLQNGSKIMENAEQRLVISAHKNRLDVITEDNQKHMFRYMNGDLYVYDENGYLIDSFKSLKNKISNIKRQETTLFSGSLTSGIATLSLGNNNSLNDFDEIIVKGTMNKNSSEPISFEEIIRVDGSSTYERDKLHPIIYTASNIRFFWIQFRLRVTDNTLYIRYNREQNGMNNYGNDTTENSITKVIGIKYKAV